MPASSVYDPTDPVGRLLFNVLAMVAVATAHPDAHRDMRGLTSYLDLDGAVRRYRCGRAV